MPHILVVDDDVSFRFFLKNLFALQGYTVSTARNGNEGQACMEQTLPDLVTLDVMMPQQSGLGLYRAMHLNPAWRHIPVIMISGVTQEAYVHALAMNSVLEEALPEPFAYVEKPPAPETVLALATTALQRAKPQGL